VTTVYGDIPVACTESGLIAILDNVVDGGPDEVKTFRISILNRLATSFQGKPCAACRFTPSTATSLEKLSTCEWRPLSGPLFVPKQSGACSSQESQAPHPYP
jgi:hypothetical protein